MFNAEKKELSIQDSISRKNIGMSKGEIRTSPYEGFDRIK